MAESSASHTKANMKRDSDFKVMQAVVGLKQGSMSELFDAYAEWLRESRDELRVSNDTAEATLVLKNQGGIQVLNEQLKMIDDSLDAHRKRSIGAS